jgi:hypothetical protein
MRPELSDRVAWCGPQASACRALATGHGQLDAEVAEPAGQGAGLAEDRGPVAEEKLAELVRGGVHGFEGVGGADAVVQASDGLVIAEVQGENEGRGRSRAEQGAGSCGGEWDPAQ